MRLDERVCAPGGVPGELVAFNLAVCREPAPANASAMQPRSVFDIRSGPVHRYRMTRISKNAESVEL